MDPGFKGDLLIPIHNLTNEEYRIDTNKALIWIEFTKTTFGVKLEEDEASTKRHHYYFPDENYYLPPETYLEKANKGNPIRSSLPSIIKESRDNVDEAMTLARQAACSSKDSKDASEKTKRLLYKVAFIGVAVLVMALAAILYQVNSIVQDSFAVSIGVVEMQKSVMTESKENTQKITELREQLEAARTETEGVRQEIINLETGLAELKESLPNWVMPKK